VAELAGEDGPRGRGGRRRDPWPTPSDCSASSAAKRLYGRRLGGMENSETEPPRGKRGGSGFLLDSREPMELARCTNAAASSPGPLRPRFARACSVRQSPGQGAPPLAARAEPARPTASYGPPAARGGRRMSWR
jgi:hypothetical protein